eukprot:TRINITY_DN7729_c0_g2_i1.p1 TRINITY_DN7729_c0_g2~~TRINITY_DN7729_c0_g2_i1.p1  ORF type:complete len:134 (+),score=5.02 TRINITY_DN7729_c0_g2_i1:442-843(+)
MLIRVGKTNGSPDQGRTVTSLKEPQTLRPANRNRGGQLRKRPLLSQHTNPSTKSIRIDNQDPSLNHLNQLQSNNSSLFLNSPFSIQTNSILYAQAVSVNFHIQSDFDYVNDFVTSIRLADTDVPKTNSDIMTT